jgi:hypothetical protein
MLATGLQNSGKSTLWEKLLWLMEGTQYESGAMPGNMRSFVAALTNHQVQIFDNIDSVNFDNPKSEYPAFLDLMCKSSSGGTLGVAELYKTNVDRKYSLRCDLFLTARENPFPAQRSDVSRRTLFFPIRQPTKEEYITVENMKSAFAADTDDMKLETLVRLQLVLRALVTNRDKNYLPVSQMHSYETYTMRVADYEGWAAEMVDIWQRYHAEYQVKTTENSPLVEYVQRWLGMKASNVDRWVRAGEMYGELEEEYDRKFTQNWRNSTSWGKQLSAHRSALKLLNMDHKISHNTVVYKFTPTPGQLEVCRQAYQDARSKLMKFSDSEASGVDFD